MRHPLLALAAASLALACAADAPTEVMLTTPTFSALGSSGDPGGGLVTKPFKADFYTDEYSLVADGCGSGIAINTQTGKGEGTHLGRFTTWMVFCFDLNAPPALGTYWFVPGPPGQNGRFVASNGDELWITVLDGYVDFFDPNLPPGYQASFHDEFFFIGGTGRFEGASGGGQINSLVGINGRTYHKWTGTLTVPSGRCAGPWSARRRCPSRQLGAAPDIREPPLPLLEEGRPFLVSPAERGDHGQRGATFA